MYRRRIACLWPCSLAVPVLAGWVYGFVVGAPEGSTDSGSGFKASQKTGYGLKSHPTDWEKPGIEPAIPGLQDIGLSPTPRRILNSHFEMKPRKTIYKYKTNIQYWRIGK